MVQKHHTLKTAALSIIPTIVCIVGSIIGANLALSEVSQALLFSATAGLVAGGLITEVVPDINRVEGHKNKQLYAIGGIIVGATVMLILGNYSTDSGQEAGAKLVPEGEIIQNAKFPITLVGAAYADVAVGSLLLAHGLREGTNPAAVMSAALEVAMVSVTVMGIMKVKECNTAMKTLGACILISGTVLGAYVGLNREGDGVMMSTPFLAGVMTSVVLWLVVLDLVPEALHAGNKQWWVGALWLATTSVGMFIGWKVEDGRRVVIEELAS